MLLLESRMLMCDCIVLKSCDYGDGADCDDYLFLDDDDCWRVLVTISLNSSCYCFYSLKPTSWVNPWSAYCYYYYAAIHYDSPLHLHHLIRSSTLSVKSNSVLYLAHQSYAATILTLSYCMLSFSFWDTMTMKLISLFVQLTTKLILKMVVVLH